MSTATFVNALASVAHLFAAVIWIGGMFFALVVLRPSSMALAPPERLSLWGGVFKRFFPWVWMSILLLLCSGFWLLFRVYGGPANAALWLHAMLGLGPLMVLLFLLLNVWPYRRFRQALSDNQLPVAAAALNRIRWIMVINLVVGLVLVISAAAGRYL